MSNRSWSIVPEQDPRHCLPDDLRARDVFGGRDCGYLEQMRPFVREFSRPGELVFDPFCGFATTLLAAELEGRRGLGTEADATRARIAQERLARERCSQQTVLRGGCLDLAATLPTVDLILTSVPYFGCRWPAEANESQLYAMASYVEFLESFRTIFAALKPRLARGGFIICMAENLRLGEQFVPLAWDVARLLGERFTMCDERVLVYEREGRDTPAPALATNRAHEYALVAQNVPRAIDISETLTIVRALQKEFPALVLHGGFARMLTGESQTLPADADVLAPFDTALLARVAAWLEARHFRILRWGAPITAATVAIAAPRSHYFRADRLGADGGLVSLDLDFDDDDVRYAHARRTVVDVDGIQISTDVDRSLLR